MNNKIKVVVGISGGVDSSVAALLLKEQGYNVQAVFMQNWQREKDDPYCTIDQDLADANNICKKLQIPLHTVNFSQKYWQKVFQYLLDEYAAGRTPNPDIMCNKEIKFKAFLDYAKELGADYIATGHYARIDYTNSHYRLLKGLDNSKDQSYFLYTLEQKQLAASIFPLGNMQKKEVRTIAKQHGFINAQKKDSTGICFIGERKFKDFLSEYLLAKPGNIVTTDGKILGRHAGIMYYTLGQRKGLGIGGQKNKPEAPWYIVSKNIEQNQLIISQDHDHPLLLSKTLVCENVHFIAEINLNFPLECSAKIRYRQCDQTCTLMRIDDGKCRVDFKENQWAITPGQSVVFYQNDECLGGGIIVSSDFNS